MENSDLKWEHPILFSLCLAHFAGISCSWKTDSEQAVFIINNTTIHALRRVACFFIVLIR